ncbi:MAG: protein kinase domain-containing protein, partial [Planctomycetota bacterium]
MTEADSSSMYKIGQNIGPYKLEGFLGTGAFGLVYKATQKKIDLPVALKIIKPGMDSKDVIARFEVERKALALFTHPNIAHIYSVGTTSHGYP